MDDNQKTSTDEAASCHTFKHSHPTALYPAPYASSPRRPTPSVTSKGGHSKATGHTSTSNTHRNSRLTNCALYTVQFTLHGPHTSKGAQNNWHSTHCQAHIFTKRKHAQFHYPSPSGPTKISSQVSPKFSNARPRQNFRSIAAIPQTE